MEGADNNTTAPIASAAAVPTATPSKPPQAKNSQQQQVNPILGRFTTVESTGNFPSTGAALGQYFSIGRLGKGTFCSIHRCINLDHFHVNEVASEADVESDKDKEKDKATTVATTAKKPPTKASKNSRRLVAAKLEIGAFQNSGVLAGEAAMLEFLDASLPKETVPLYMGHLHEASGNVAAIIMEYLPGRDMHQIRDATTRGRTRRLTVENAVYLTADVMLPLLENMHKVGIVHRDVKPSNCVKRGGKQFAMVDFGLSKSIVVPSDSPMSDANQPWKGDNWMRPPTCTAKGHYRQERPNADFRGTSMYASLRIHQLKDYCPRDDLWSLMYVFCDLVSGGLPWMSYAASKERAACHKLKERIHGETENEPHATHELLQGYEYHIEKAKIERENNNNNDDENSVGPQLEVDERLPTPLKMSEDARLVELLKVAFDHLRGLAFCDMPDYGLIRRSLLGFLETPSQDDNDKLMEIAWDTSDAAKNTQSSTGGSSMPQWQLHDHDTDLTDQLFKRAEQLAEGERVEEGKSDESGKGQIPLGLQFRVAQMEYNAKHSKTIPVHIALHDWMQASIPILYGKWDSRKYEKGGHRRDDDGYRRENYLRAIGQCLRAAEKFGCFRDRSIVYEDGSSANRRPITASIGENSSGKPADLALLSRILFGLRKARRCEEGKKFAPPPVLSFGSN